MLISERLCSFVAWSDLLNDSGIQIGAIHLLVDLCILTRKIGDRTRKLIFAQSKTEHTIDCFDHYFDAKTVSNGLVQLNLANSIHHHGAMYAWAQMSHMEFFEAVLRCAYWKRKLFLDENPDDGGGLTAKAIASELRVVISLMKSSSILKVGTR